MHCAINGYIAILLRSRTQKDATYPSITHEQNQNYPNKCICYECMFMFAVISILFFCNFPYLVINILHALSQFLPGYEVNCGIYHNKIMAAVVIKDLTLLIVPHHMVR